VSCVDFRYIDDVLTPEESIDLLRRVEPTRGEREAELLRTGYPAYTTSAGWLGYTDDKVARLVAEAIEQGFTHVKMKVGRDLEEDMRRAAVIRGVLGSERRLMMDANQTWGVDRALHDIAALAVFDPWWIEEPTSPDDVLGHARIRKAISPIRVATGEHVQNRIIFKQLFQAEAIDVCQIDACRVAGVNEVLAIMLMAAKFGIPICPHAGGVGLCEYVQHLAVFDFVCVSGSLENRVVEWVDHLHEHFRYPAVVEGGRYRVPRDAGYSVEMIPASLAEYAFPQGPIWSTAEALVG
jgi:L-fuconate dehydratase